MQRCRSCSAEIVEDARFCPFCGQKVEALFASVVDEPTVKDVPVPSAVAQSNEEEEAPHTVADPFTHTAPASPEELQRLSAMIEAANREGVPVRQRVLGSTTPLVAVDDRRASDDDPVRLDRTMQSGAVADERVAKAPLPSVPIPRPPARDPSSAGAAVSPRAATHAEAPGLHPGSLVRVLWSDGQSYPATVVQMAPAHLLVQFGNGHQQWVELRYISPAQ
ncbi:MAG: zinc-ribbon domain-containing protein [Myxococcales bacterium]|nr:zinc-ribbon domain-containing protein [Myxococcales bacterium]